MDSLLARLDSAVARLTGGGDDDGEGVPASVSEYQAYYAAHVQPFLDACAKFDDVKKIGEWTAQAWTHQGVLMEMASQCKKPSDEAMMGQLGPIVEVFNAAGNPDTRSPSFPQEKAFAEALGALNWVMAGDGALPGPMVDGGLDAADFYLNKALTACKELEDPSKTDRRAFVSTLKTMIKELSKYVRAFHKTGLSWKIKGADVSEFKPGQKASCEGKEDSPESRLEGAVLMLEAHIAKMSAGDGDGPAPAVVEWEAYMEASVKPFIATCNNLEEAKKIGEFANTAFTHMSKVIRASVVCAKPSQEDFMAFLAPIVGVITATQEADGRDPFGKAFAEGIQSLSWIMMDLPRPFIIGQLEASDFYLNKVLTTAKDKDDATKAGMRDFVKQYKALLNDMAKYAVDFHKTGLNWKMRDGSPLKEYTE